ncbi:Uncharacterised protein [uncultured archaeon]|nr:Uncharacterised protein [uncultured archaeon]
MNPIKLLQTTRPSNLHLQQVYDNRSKIKQKKFIENQVPLTERDTLYALFKTKQEQQALYYIQTTPKITSHHIPEILSTKQEITGLLTRLNALTQYRLTNKELGKTIASPKEYSEALKAKTEELKQALLEVLASK